MWSPGTSVGDIPGLGILKASIQKVRRQSARTIRSPVPAKATIVMTRRRRSLDRGALSTVSFTARSVFDRRTVDKARGLTLDGCLATARTAAPSVEAPCDE